jgi:DNA polymerase-3 subunit delta'
MHHALLLKGQEGIGKTELAQDLARYLLCSNKQQKLACGQCQACKLYKAGSHPDFHEIESDKQIGVDQVREAIKKLLGTAQLSGSKVLVIYAAHTMTESSANALLKTLEEPTKNTYLLMISSKPERLLPTILSRCEKVLLPSPDINGTTEWLKTKGFADVEPKFMRLYPGSPLMLLNELQVEQSFNYQQFLQGLESLLSQQGNVAELSSKWQEHAEKVIKWLQYWLLDQMKSSPEMMESLWSLHEASAKAVKALRNPGINKTLLLANLLNALVLLQKEPTQNVAKFSKVTSFR